MSKTAGCFDFLRGRRSSNKRAEAVAPPLEAQRPQRHHGGGQVVSRLALLRVIFNPLSSQRIPAF